MNNTILVGRCNDELNVAFPFYWASRIIEEAEKLEYDIIDLREENYVEEKVKSLIESKSPGIIFLNGHGNEYCTKGHGCMPVIIANKNDILLKDKIVYVLSCKTAKYLGPAACDKGCEAYIGYLEDFAFVYLDDNPLNDHIAKIYMEASNEIPLTILNGGSPKQAYENSQKIFEKWISFWEERWSGKAEPKIPIQAVGDILATLIADKEGQILFWNKSFG